MDSDKYIGRLLDNRYEIQEVIGIGGMAVVYKARCHRLNRLVAIKILKDDYSQDDDFRRRFHAEGQAVAMLSHPNIVSVYDVSSSPEADYIVMELIDGISLKQYMGMKGVLNWKETLHFAMQIGKALEHAHSRGIVHRDIKPHNVMVLKNGSVKVADFGIARIMSKGNTLTKEALGSVHYISPEQAKGGRVDNRSDIYSLGVVMYEMMTGRPPYDGESPVAVAIQHINGGAPMPSTLNPNIPGGLEQIIMKSMAHDPNNRYATAAAMLYDMDEFRKNPSILFDYNVPPLDDVTRIHNKPLVTPEILAAVPPKNTAERVAASRTGQTGSRPARSGAPRQTGSGSGVSRQTGSRPAGASSRSQNTGKTPQRRAAPARRRSSEAEEQQNKVATIAVIVCAIAIIIALFIVLGVIFGGGSEVKTPDKVYVPSLIGKDYYNLAVQQGIVIGTPQFAYSEDHAEGIIVDQNPKAGEKVAEGTEVILTVSLGKEPEIKTMWDFVDTELATAQNFLAGQNLNLNVLPKAEFSDEVEANFVIRTEPAKGEPLQQGPRGEEEHRAQCDRPQRRCGGKDAEQFRLR